MSRLTRALTVIAVALLAAAPAEPAAADDGRRSSTPIEHFIFLMQGARSFDNYFGTYPGAEGPPRDTCQPLVAGRPQNGCVKPFSLRGLPPPTLGASRGIVAAQVNGGRMDGFVAAYYDRGRDGTATMGYYDDRDLPFYWNVARRYVLFDHFFAAARYGMRLNRSYWVAAAPPPGGRERVPTGGYGNQPTIFDRLQAAGVSWKFYVQDYDPRETFRSASPADPATQAARVPLLTYARFVDDPVLRSHIVDLGEYYRDVTEGTLPAVAYVASAGANERTASSLPAGQKLVRTMTNQLIASRYWRSCAFMWSYDGSGGWYDHVPPPAAGGDERGLRVPALLVSPYARQGHVNRTVLDSTSALKFVEDNWRLESLTSRDASATGLSSAFDFGGKPARAELIPVGVTPPAAAPVNATPIYWCYGSAALLVIALLVAAATTPAGGRRRRAGRRIRRTLTP
jgi:phospholipase C